MHSTRTALSLFAFTVGGGMLWASSAAAHINLTTPASRYGQDLIKDAPCGQVGNPPGANPPHVYEVGETITLVVDEFVGHNGHLRVAWAEHDEDIVTITAFDDFDNFPGVLLDNIEDLPGGGVFNIEVTLPDTPCDNCTLQVIQVMYDGDGFQENDLYYTCADITLVPVGAGTAGDTGAPADSGGSDGASTSGGPIGDTSGDDSTPATDGGPGPAGDGASAADDGAGDGAGSTSGSGGGSDSAAGGDGDSGGCACRSEPAQAPWWLAFGVFGLIRRRRR